MLRNIFRTSRWLARRQINSFAPMTLRQLQRIEPVHSSSCDPLRNSCQYSTTTSDDPQSETVDPAIFEEICNETLESLTDYFEELVDDAPNLKRADVTYSDGVLTVSLGSNYGTYVINRQSPNKQIWLSSPVSGPKRYDLVLKNGGYWAYKHDGKTLHQLLQEEISKIVTEVEFKNCAHSS
ncbi:putative frataxin, mitochondrial [Operophtera brumata]|uniref:ferroxidase n=1 Tax=Operophtera brumata TaxID=104452 RepID=A0A0L7LHM1_OPEBR|nr:putative frataxin, mitochondrial [Operophtera brumata]